MENKDPRYPWTYSADFLRSLVGYNERGTKMSRADAANIKAKIAEILEIDEYYLASKLADYYLAHQEEITNQSVKQFMEGSSIFK